MPEDSGRITVSRDALRAELLGLELRLVEKLATKDEVAALQADHVELEKRVTLLERVDGDRRAVSRNADELFSRREKRIGLALALLAGVLQVLIVTGVFR